jgi:DNA-binding Xre family transcriptional regulator
MSPFDAPAVCVKLHASLDNIRTKRGWTIRYICQQIGINTNCWQRLRRGENISHDALNNIRLWLK